MILSLLVTLIAAAPGAAAGQQTADSRTALVTVSDARNRAIVDLGPDDFVITERGQTREILDARMADYPVIILVDTGGGARESFPEIQKAVARFVARLGQRPIALGRLSDQTHGQFTAIFSPASYQIALDRLADRLAAEMMVEYIVPPRSAATDIQVGVRIPGARARGLGVRPR